MGPVLLVLAVDLVVFSSVLTLLITGLREGRMSPAMFRVLALGLLQQPDDRVDGAGAGLGGDGLGAAGAGAMNS